MPEIYTGQGKAMQPHVRDEMGKIGSLQFRLQLASQTG
jgi:hypothetical protein